jgi:predicted nucleic acid-binding protein
VIVVDTCVALAWVLDETPEHRRYAAAVIEAKFAGIALIAPQLMQQEVASKLLAKGRHLKWGEARTAEYGETIDAIGVRLLDVSSLVAAHIRFSTRWNVQGFDAVFLALAMSTRATLATFDGGLIAAARSAGVEVFAA